jgi:hypothetical protein
LEDSRAGRFKSENAGNTRVASIMLPVHIAEWIEHTAHQKDKTSEQFLRELVVEIFSEQTEPLDVRLQRLDGLIEKMAVLVRKMAMQVEKDAKTGIIAHEGRRKKRDHLIELGLEAYDELRKISRSEEASKEAEFRLQAFMVMARLGSFTAAVIHDQETEDLTQLIMEVEETNERLEDELKKVEKKRREEEEEEKDRWRAAAI